MTRASLKEMATLDCTHYTLTKLQGPYMQLPKLVEILRLWAKP